ncbi:MAG: TerB family tellurite resistance protein [Deltaproteobacteria bacterium]|nr:TerB family tellurite resistance protein [Deltaproteobacteria bacterium]
MEQLIAIAELLLGAAHADGTVSWAERGVMGKVLASFVGTGELPDAVQAAISAFDPASFDVARAVSKLTLTTRRDRAELLGIVSQIVDADATLEPDEEGYLRRVAEAIGASDDELLPFLEPD